MHLAPVHYWSRSWRGVLELSHTVGKGTWWYLSFRTLPPAGTQPFCHIVTPNLGYQPIPTVYDSISTNTDIKQYIQQDRTLLLSVPEATEDPSVVAYSLGLGGHVTHLRSPPEMRHAAKNSLSLAEWFRATNWRRRC